MNANAVIETTGWTLAHFLWQATAVALVVAVVTRGLKSASARYLAATSAMAILLAIAGITFGLLLPERAGLVSVVAPGSFGPVSESSDPGPAPSESAPTALPVTSPPAVASLNSTALSEIPPAPGAGIPWQTWVVALWLCGVGLFGLRFFRDWRAALVLRKTARPLRAGSDLKWEDRFAELSRRIGISRPVKLLTSTAVHVPAALGVLRPVVIVPVATLANLPPAQVDAVLLHELAHVRRHDFLINLLQTLAETLFFFHPAVWWISEKIREERENCCDDLASECCGDVRAYAGALAALEESCGKSGTSLGMAADGEKKRGLVRRIQRLVGDGETNPTGPGWPVFVMMALVVAGAVLAFTMMNDAMAADDEDKQGWPAGVPEQFRGIDLRDFARNTDLAKLPDLYRSAGEGDFFRVEGRSQLPVFSAGGDDPDDDPAAWLIILPAGKGFYLCLNDEDEKRHHFGPIPGDPIEKLNFLSETARRLSDPEQFSSRSRSWRHAAYTVRELLKMDSVSARLGGFSLLEEMPEPKDLGEYDEYLSLAEAALERPMTDADRERAEARLATFRTTMARLDERRVELDPEKYFPPREPDQPAPETISWGRENDGLRFGIGPPPASVWRYGDEFRTQLWIENVSDEPVFFSSYGPRPDEGYSIEMTDGRGRTFRGEMIRTSIKPMTDRTRLESGEKGWLKTITWRVRPPLDRENGEHSALHDLEGDRSWWGISVLALASGNYRFRVRVGLPGFQKWNYSGGSDRKIVVPAKGEWTGGLNSAEINVEVRDRPDEAGARKPAGNAGIIDQTAGNATLIRLTKEGNISCRGEELTAEDFLHHVGVNSDPDRSVLLSAPEDAPYHVVMRVLKLFYASGNFWNISIISEEEAEKLAESQPREIVVTVSRDGKITVGGEEIEGDELTPHLRTFHAAPDHAVILRASEDMPFRQVTAVLDRIKEAGIWNVSFGTREKTSDTPKQVPASGGPPAAPVVDRPVAFDGRIVDAATGEPIRQAVIVQGGLVKENQEVEWGFSEQRGEEPDGSFAAVLNLARNEIARVLADGYLPQPLFDIPPDLPPGTKETQVTVRLTRGRKISGRVLDHEGNPVAGASVFAIRPAKLNLYAGEAWTGSGADHRIDSTAQPVKTDAIGEFSGLHLSGTDRIAVSSSELDAWPQRIRDGLDHVEIRLPQPATLVLAYDIPGAPEKAPVYCQYLTPFLDGGEPWKDLGMDRDFLVGQGRTDLRSLPPGHYQILREKNEPPEQIGPHFGFDREYFGLEPGGTHVINWNRKGIGARVKARFTWPQDEKLAGVYYTLNSKTPNKDLGGLDVPTVLDGGRIDLKTGALFSTVIPAGDYVLTLEAGRPVSEERLRISSPILPDYNKSIEITVPEKGGGDFDIGTISILDDHTAHWKIEAPARVSLATKEGDAIVTADTIQFAGDAAWPQPTMHFHFDEPTTVELVKLELLPQGNRYGRTGKGKLMLSGLRPELRDTETGKRIENRQVEFSLCRSPLVEDDGTLDSLFDHQSDTGWNVPPPAPEEGELPPPVELDFYLRSPVLILPGQELVLTLDTPGPPDFDTPARIRFAFSRTQIAAGNSQP